MAKLDRKSLLNRKPKTAEIKLPDGDTVTIRALTAGQVDEYAKKHKGSEDEFAMLCGLIIAGTVDEHGKPMFTNDDIDAIKCLPIGDLKAMGEGVARISAIIPAEDSKKNSNTTTAEDSPTDSH
jgi:hypothetical protein